MWRYLNPILLWICGSRRTKNVTLGNGVTLPYKPNRLGRNSFPCVDYTGSALQFRSCHLLLSLWLYVLQQMRLCLWHKTSQIDQSVLKRSTDGMGTIQNDRCIVFWTTDASKHYILISLTWAKHHNGFPHFTVRDHAGMCHQSFSLWSAEFSTHILTAEWKNPVMSCLIYHVKLCHYSRILWIFFRRVIIYHKYVAVFLV